MTGMEFLYRYKVISICHIAKYSAFHEIDINRDEIDQMVLPARGSMPDREWLSGLKPPNDVHEPMMVEALLV